MTFGAMAAWQAWLLLAAGAALAAWLFLLKVRPPRVPVPSLMLWRRVLDETREQTLWERIRRAVSLALSVLIAVMLALAVVRPTRRSAAAGTSGERVLIVVDSSWSMLARTSTGETRWDRAIAEAHRVLAATSGEAAVATTADGLVEGPSSDRALLDSALDRISPGGGETTAWPQVAGTTAAHFITDGAAARPLQPDVVIHSVFERASNVAITAFEVRRAIADDRAADAYLEIVNYAPSAQQVRLTLARGAAPVLDRKLLLAAGEALKQVIPIPRGTDATLRARVVADANALDVDDEAFGWIERTRGLTIALVGEEVTWLRSLLERDPSIRLSIVAPSAYPRGTERSDVVIFDRWMPPTPPAGPAMYFAPPSGRNPVAEDRPIWTPAAAHPVVRGVDPFTLTIERARAYRLPNLVAVASSSRGTPLIYVNDSADARSVLVTFGIHESNLTSAPAFPVLVGNAIDWLTTSPAAAPEGVRPGLSTFDDAVSSVTGPRGVPVRLARIAGTAIGVLPAPGLYEVRAGGMRRAIGVNVGDPQVSNLARTTLDTTRQARAVGSGGSGRPWWIYCALVAFGLLSLEWWTWQRRITV